MQGPRYNIASNQHMDAMHIGQCGRMKMAKNSTLQHTCHCGLMILHHLPPMLAQHLVLAVSLRLEHGRRTLSARWLRLLGVALVQQRSKAALGESLKDFARGVDFT